jgi:adenylate cyclase
MRRPHPIRRLIDGTGEDSGRAIAWRFGLLTIPALIGSSAIGAVVVFVLAVWGIPTPELEDLDRVRTWNLIAAGAYVLLAAAIGTAWGLRTVEPTRVWLVEERRPTESEQRTALRTPVGLARVSAVLWLIGAVAFAALNATWSLELSLRVGLTVLLGGLTTSAASYLVAERINRPVAARALKHGVPERPALPGISARAVLAWALGTGVPVMGLVLVAVSDLGGSEISERELAITSLALGGVALVVGALMAWQSARATAEPVLSVRQALQRIEQGDLDSEVPVYDGSEVGLLQAGFNRTAAGLRDREELRDLFGRHVGKEVAQEAVERGIELGGEEREVAVLFVDLEGSTTLAAERPPAEVVELLNAFFRIVVEAVEEHGGWINKFEGDAALAVFGAPLPDEKYASAALAAGRELAGRLEEVEGLEAGIGISAGKAVAGNVGAEHRFEYTVIGDPVNEAARLSDLAKEADGRLLASVGALERAGAEEAGHWRLGDEVELRGRREPTRLARPA